MRQELTNRRIWITGATSGIGKAMALELADRGNQLILSARSKHNLQEVQSHHPDSIQIIDADLSDPKCAASLRTRLSELTPALDTVILNAGSCEYIEIENFDIAAVERITQVNYLGFARCVYAALPLLLQSQAMPHLVGISSASAYFGLPRAQAYGASKAAVSYFLESMRVDLYRKGVDVSVVFPGFVDTPLTRKNDFPMPGLISEEQACQRILSGIENRANEISFPRPLILTLKLLSALPSSWSTRLAQRIVRQKPA